MHIVDGALADPILIAGGVATAAGIGLGMRKLEADKLPQVAVLSAVFFVASLVHVPVGPSSVHLILNGLIGLVLGWAAFPALAIALLLQAVFFGFGGVTVLGINTLAIALPAIAAHHLCGPLLRRGRPTLSFLWGALAGGGALALSTLLIAAALALSGEAFLAAAKMVFVAHLPVIGVEALLTGAAVVLLRKVKPELLFPEQRLATVPGQAAMEPVNTAASSPALEVSHG